MVRQEIQFMHDPAQIRLASFQLCMKRLREPVVVIIFTALAFLFVIGLLTSHLWMLALPLASCGIMLMVAIQYIWNAPRNFRGVEVRMSVQDNGLHFTGPHRSAIIDWAGFKEVYPLKQMWALFLINSDSVTMIPTEQLTHETLEFILARLRENHVKIHGDRLKQDR